MYQRILVPVDGSPTSNRALTHAIELAQTFHGRLRLVHVLGDAAYLAGYDAGAGELLAAMRDAAEKIVQEGTRIVAAAGVEADGMVFDKLGERLGESVATAAKLWGADLIVLGTHGRRGIGRLLLGSGAEQVIRLATVPVLVIRGGDEARGAEPAAP